LQDAINWGYLSLREEDYEWITRQLVKVANSCCSGRLVSVLEGGYRIAGRIVSPFGRSVAAHVRALASGSVEKWDTERERALLVEELQAERRAEEAAVAAAALAAAARVPLASPRPRVSVLATAVKPASAMLSLATGATHSGAGSSSSFAGLPSPAPTPVSASVTAARAVALAGVSGFQVDKQAIETSVAASESASSNERLSDIRQDDEVTGGGNTRPPSKRRRSAAKIDFAALDAQMRAEDEAAKRMRQGDLNDSGS